MCIRDRKCFFTAVVGAVLSRLLYSWYHYDADSAHNQLGIESMLQASDISTAPTQMLAYVLIGLACGFMGSMFVRLNAKWMALRKAKTAAGWWLFKQKTAYEIGVRLVGSEMCIRDRADCAPSRRRSGTTSRAAARAPRRRPP